MSADGPSGGRGRVRVGLVVVHGVGETEPGYCVNAVLDTLAATRPGYSVSPANEYNRLHEPEAGKPAPVFPVIRRGAAHNSGIEIEAVELHWADLTEGQPGRVNTLLQLFRVIFESHHLVDAMLDRSRDATSWILRKLLWVAGWLIRGPSAALTIVTSAICALFLFEPVAMTTDVADVRSQVLLMTAAIFIGSLYVFYRISRRQDYSWYDTVFWLMLASLAVFVLTYNNSLLGLLKHIPELEIGPARLTTPQALNCLAGNSNAACYIDGLYKIIIWGWRFWGGLLVFATFLLAIAWVRARITRDRSRLGTLSTSIAILIMQFMLWTTVVVSVIYPMLNRAETITTLKEARPIIQRAIDAHQLDANSPIAKLVQVPNIELDWIGRFKFIYASAAFTVLILTLAAILLIEIRQIKARRGLSDLEQTARNMPRLLFNPVLVGLLIFAFLIVFAMVFVQPYLDKNEVFVTLRGYILPVAAGVALILPFFFGRRVANVANFARDLIDHHYQPRQETAAYVIPSVFRVRHRRLRRERIQSRLNLVLEHFVQNQGYDGVIFLAHSQGSMIVYDFLRDNGPHYTRLGDAAPALLTFGSPLGSIYQKYFHEYAAAKPVPLGIAAKLKCWINLYRVDDYIGGRISPPPGLRVDNHVMGIGGHTGYWAEPDVAEALDAILTGKVADATKPPPLPPPPATPVGVLRGSCYAESMSGRAIRIIGFDPGLRRTGWGVIESDGVRLVYVASGVIIPPKDDDLAYRLSALFDEVTSVIQSFSPSEAAVEETFVNENPRSTLKLGQARGAILLAPARLGLRVAEYTPNLIKKSVTGVGHAEKQQIQAMVSFLLPKATFGCADEADALAIAITHAHHRVSRQRLAAFASKVAET